MSNAYKLDFNIECSFGSRGIREAEIKVVRMLDAIYSIMENAGMDVWIIDREINLLDVEEDEDEEKEE